MRFIKNRLGRKVPERIESIGEVIPYEHKDKRHEKYITQENTVNRGKIVDSLKEAIIKSNLKDGMTISFHHHLRNGDYVLSTVMEEISKLGIKDLSICASSLTKAHECLIEYIKDGTVTGLQTSGMRGALAESI